jgi:hypothetical protein
MPDLSSQAQYKHIVGTAAGTTVVLDRNGTFERVVFNQNQTGTVTFYDTPLAAGSTSANLISVMNNNVGSLPMSVNVGARVRTGLVAVVGGTTDFTVIYN